MYHTRLFFAIYVYNWYSKSKLFDNQYGIFVQMANQPKTEQREVDGIPLAATLRAGEEITLHF